MIAKNIEIELINKYSPIFGQIAVEKGYVSAEQVKQVILEQLTDDLASRPHRPIGRIMLEKGWINAQQIEAVLNELFKES